VLLQQTCHRGSVRLRIVAIVDREKLKLATINTAAQIDCFEMRTRCAFDVLTNVC
jgi:hypothetical protein